MVEKSSVTMSSRFFFHHHHIEDDGLVGIDCDDKVDGNVYLLNFCHVTPNFAMLKYVLYIYLIRYHIIYTD